MPAPEHEGAVEGDKPTDCPQQGNANAPALNADGLPDEEDAEKIEEDAASADFDQTTG